MELEIGQNCSKLINGLQVRGKLPADVVLDGCQLLLGDAFLVQSLQLLQRQVDGFLGRLRRCVGGYPVLGNGPSYIWAG